MLARFCLVATGSINLASPDVFLHDLLKRASSVPLRQRRALATRTVFNNRRKLRGCPVARRSTPGSTTANKVLQGLARISHTIFA
jgi:hypothetical protein